MASPSYPDGGALQVGGPDGGALQAQPIVTSAEVIDETVQAVEVLVEAAIVTSAEVIDETVQAVEVLVEAAIVASAEVINETVQVIEVGVAAETEGVVATQADRIHNTIYAAVQGHAFPEVAYDPQTGLRTTTSTNPGTVQTLIVREVSSAFDEALGQRRTPRLRERTDWVWEVLIAFDGQVSLESFEKQYSDAPMFLPRTSVHAQQVVIQLGQVDYTHPPEQQSSSGTRATLTFTASLSRK